MAPARALRFATYVADPGSSAACEISTLYGYVAGNIGQPPRVGPVGPASGPGPPPSASVDPSCEEPPSGPPTTASVVESPSGAPASDAPASFDPHPHARANTVSPPANRKPCRMTPPLSNEGPGAYSSPTVTNSW